jgi:hypothetical protein
MTSAPASVVVTHRDRAVGAEQGAQDGVGQDDGERPDEAGGRQQDGVPVQRGNHARQQPCHDRRRETDEPERAGQRDGDSREDDGEHHADPAGPAHGDAHRAGGVVAEPEHVEVACEQERARRRDDDRGRRPPERLERELAQGAAPPGVQARGLDGEEQEQRGRRRLQRHGDGRAGEDEARRGRPGAAREREDERGGEQPAGERDAARRP